MVELIAEERRNADDGHAHAAGDAGAGASSSFCPVGGGVGGGFDEPDPTGITR